MTQTAGERPRPLAVLRAFIRCVVDIWGWRLAGIAALMGGTALAAGASLLAMFQVLRAAAGMGEAQLVQFRHWWPGGSADAPPTLTGALAALVAVTIVQGVLAQWQGRAIAAAVEDVELQLRQRLFAELSRMKWAAYSRIRSSELHALLTDHVARTAIAARSLLMLASMTATAGIYGIIALRAAWAVTLLAAGIGATLGLLLSHQRRRALAIGKTVTAASRHLHAAISESLAGMKIVRATGAGKRQAELLLRASTAQQDAAIQLTLAHGAARAWFDVGNMVALSIVAFVALGPMALPPTELFALLFVFMRLAPQASGIHQSYQQLKSELPAFQDVSTALDSFASEAEPATGPRPPITFERECRLDRVSFSYGDIPVVTDVSVTITRGRTVAIVGASGAGKTTLADLALGLLSPASGAILVDDVALSERSLESWRARTGYVPQDAFLFHDTIRANLLWAAPDAGEDELWRALWSASAGFVAALPHGLDTVVGDRGILLSGGERQRIALARTLLRAPDLLILDEPTSALDADNARAVHEAIAALHGSVAILLITHRLATVRDAHLIYVLDRGRIVESGTWTELVAIPGGRLDALCRAQGVELEPQFRVLSSEF